MTDLRPCVDIDQMLHNILDLDPRGTGEDGAVAHAEVTLGLVSLPVSPGQAEVAAVGLVLAGSGHLGRQSLRSQGSDIAEGGPAQDRTWCGCGRRHRSGGHCYTVTMS